MKRAWQAWLGYAVCLAVAVPALVWLTLAALSAEWAEQTAREAARREERFRQATWRLDTMLMPIVTPQVARSYEDHRVDAMTNGLGEKTAALESASKYVLGFFDVERGGDAQITAKAHVTPEQQAQLTDELAAGLGYKSLAARLPDELLEPRRAADPEANLAALDRAAQQMQAPQADQLDSDYARRQMSNVKSIAQQRAAKGRSLSQVPVEEAVGRPIWLGNALLVARRARVNGRSDSVFGCLLDWQQLRDDMTSEIDDLLPGATLRPLREGSDVNYAHALATLPVEVVAPEIAVAGAGWTPLRIGLSAAWLGLVVAGVASALLLAGVIALGQRREAFVSAVTHELRTPLTTFRMYCEMLDSGQVADETQRKEYLRTLRVEAERLRHLVENVLSYARVERGRALARRERVTLGGLWAQMESRLGDRAREADMQIVPHFDEAIGRTTLETDPAAVEQIVFNLVDNACKYAGDATARTIDVEAAADKGQVRFRVRDHGSGIAAADARALFRPFSKSAEAAAASAPGVGLGLALSRQLARQMGGDLKFVATAGGGATFELSLPRG